MSDLFDDLRSRSGGSLQFEEEGEDTSFADFSSLESYDDLDDDPRPKEDRPRARKRRGKGFLGMSAFQRFVLVFLLFILSVVFSSACLLVTNKIVVF
jgi:hypothetical protein